jgi:hypothetical protein
MRESLSPAAIWQEVAFCNVMTNPVELRWGIFERLAPLQAEAQTQMAIAEARLAKGEQTIAGLPPDHPHAAELEELWLRVLREYEDWTRAEQEVECFVACAVIPKGYGKVITTPVKEGRVSETSVAWRGHPHWIVGISYQREGHLPDHLPDPEVGCEVCGWDRRAGH